ncbi:MAG: AAA family ATPase, partial [Candidatus Methanomethylophilaceae archaeon]|nr:AAA family ATPase [Candidatus Methanomethylophilaceae archaeon]
MSDWTEKYRPRTLDGVVGNPSAVNALRAWAKSWSSGTPSKRAVVLMGSPGVGKTTSAEALAREMGWDVVEMNASDQRSAEDIEKIALRGSMFDSFGDDGSFGSSADGKRKLIILDEADNFFGKEDRGAVPAVSRLIRETRQPIILIVNDFYELSRKSSAIKNETMQITFQRPTSVSIMKALRNICKGEGIEIDDDALKAIADNSNGDVRAAVRDLESVSLGRTRVTDAETSELSNRIVRKSIYDLMYATFRKNDPFAARRMMMDIDEEPKMVMSWVDENLPMEYRDPSDLY